MESFFKTKQLFRKKKIWKKISWRHIFHRGISACDGICSFLSFGMWLIMFWLLGLFAGMCMWCVHRDNVIHSLCHQNSYLYYLVTDIYRTEDVRAKRPPGKAVQLCLGPADTADIRLKGFLMNPCPLSPERRTVWFGNIWWPTGCF